MSAACPKYLFKVTDPSFSALFQLRSGGFGIAIVMPLIPNNSSVTTLTPNSSVTPLTPNNSSVMPLTPNNSSVTPLTPNNSSVISNAT